MKPDTPLEAATHYLWPVFVFAIGVIGWFIKRELSSIGADLRESRDTGRELKVWSEEHDASDTRQFGEAKERAQSLGHQVDDVRKMVFDNESAARTREELYRAHPRSA